MGSSDSETESENFESAEESFDEEDEKKHGKSDVNKNLEKSDKEDSKLISDCNTLGSGRESEEDTSGTSVLSYRKRPERVKRMPSRTQTKPTPKSPTNESIFRPDKIVSDVFLQDITSNLSKNINKSLNTLQQKSSNVKDLILNSLPTSSVDDNYAFSYDDNSHFEDDNQMLNAAANYNHSAESQENIREKKEMQDEKPNIESDLLKEESKVIQKNVKDEEEIHSVRKSSVESDLIINKVGSNVIKEHIKGEKEIPVIKKSSAELDLLITDEENNHKIISKSENSKNSLKSEFCVQNISTDRNLEKGSLEKCGILCENSESLGEQARNTCTEKVNTTVNESKEIIQEINNTCLNHENVDILHKEEETKISDVIKRDLVKELDQKVEICEENISIEPNLSVKITEKEILESKELSKLMQKDDSASLENCEESHLNYPVVEKSEVESECNLEELKTALKNIVNEESIPSKEDVHFEDKEEGYQNSGDGWDDFSFSDEEVENSNAPESNKVKEFEDLKTNNVMTKSSPNVNPKSSGNKTEAEIKQSKSLVDSKKSLENTSLTMKNIAVKENFPSFKTHEVKETEKLQKSVESNLAENDSWDWDDWDENPESTEDGIKPVQKSEGHEESDNLSKWSGWDTFGQKPQEKQDSWGLGSWGVDALLNKATAVTQGISSVLEAGLGAPDPETLARIEKMERENLLESSKEVSDTGNISPAEISKKNSLTNVNIFPVSGITSLVAGVTSKIVEHSKIQEIGSKVITGGLETLETFGKKTMEVLQEGDPGLKNKRALLLGNNKPVLSQVLREAREKADRESKKAEEKELAKKCHFETLFDDFQGMVHLEALEMLSRQCELKLDQIRSGMNSEEQEDLNGILEEVEQLCSLDEYDIDMKSSMLDFKTLLQMAVEPLKNEISIQNIVQIHEDVNKWLQVSSEAEPSFTIINQKLVSTLAELTAATVHQFHKSGELLSVKECRKTVEEVDALSRLTNALCIEINKLGEKFFKLSCNKISKDASGDDINAVNEKVNSVMKNSIFYIKQAFNLLIPVVQLGAAV